MKWLAVSMLVLLALSSCVKPAPTSESPAPLSPGSPGATDVGGSAATAPEGPALMPTPSPQPTGTGIPFLTPGGPVVITYVDMPDPFQGWARGTSGTGTEHILHTAHAGDSWDDITPPVAAPEPGTSLEFLTFFLDKTTAWAIPITDSPPLPTAPSAVWRTTDGGATWQSSPDLRTPDLIVEGWSPAYMTFTDAQHGWLMVGAGAGAGHAYVVIFRTTDGGATWQQLIDPNSLNSAAVHVCCQSGLVFANPDVGLIPLADSNYMKVVVNWTADGGASWTSSFPPPPESAPDLFERSSCAVSSTVVLSPADIRLGVRCRVLDGGSDQSYVYATRDQGETWTITSFPGGELLYLDAGHGLALGRDIFATENGGETWSKIKSVSWDGQFSFFNKDLGWAVARSGDAIALVRTRDGGRQWEEIEAVVAP